jgi:SNF2 family DNA or RNA helicase
VASNFVSEIVHWAPHRHAIMIGKRPKHERDMLFNILLPAMEEYTVVINYSAWRKDKTILDKLVECRFEMMIMDEAHIIKNVRSAAYKGCEKIALSENSCPECRGRIQPVHDSSDRISNDFYAKRDYNVCVGENGVTSQRLDISEKITSLGCGWSEENAYCEKSWTDGKIRFRSGGLESLLKRLSGLYIGRDRKSAGVVLPKQEIIVHNLEFNKVKYADQARIIKQLSQHAMLMLSSGKAMPIPAIIALITRKRQANVWPAGIEVKDPETGIVVFSVSEDVNESQKVDFIIERPATSDSGEWEGLGWDITGEGDKVNGERLAIFSQFKTPLAELEKRFKEAGVSVVRFDGDTDQVTKDQAKIDFDRNKQVEGQDYKWQVILCNYKTGGVGLNFSDVTQTIILDEEWNPGKRDQAYARTDRMGQTEETTVHVLRQEESIDTWMAELIQSKEDMINAFESGTSLQQAFMDFLKGEAA